MNFTLEIIIFILIFCRTIKFLAGTEPKANENKAEKNQKASPVISC
jgi:hypothetical protein